MNRHSIVNGELQHVSPSQVVTYDLCPARWYAEKRLHLREPPSPALDMGINMHGEMEKFYEGGPEPTHPSSQMMLKDERLPQRGPGVVVEHPRDYALGLTAAGIPVVGRMDLVNLNSDADPLKPRVVDWKSTKAFTWTKTPEQLASNIQLCVYGAYMFAFHLSDENLVSCHGYLLTQGVGAKLVLTDPLPRSHFDGFWGWFEERVTKMRELARVSPEAFKTDVPRIISKKTCRAFNKPCPAAGYCGEEALRAAGIELPPTTPNLQEPYMSLSEMVTTRREELSLINPPEATPSVTATPPPAQGTAHVSIAGAVQVPLELYIDCVPMKGKLVNLRLEEEIARRAEPIAKRFGVTDVREVKYAEGTSALMASFQKDPLAGVVLATSCGLSSQVLEILSSQASVVVRGVR